MSAIGEKAAGTVAYYFGGRFRIDLQYDAENDENHEVKIVFGFDTFLDASAFTDGLVKQAEGPDIHIKLMVDPLKRIQSA